MSTYSSAGAATSAPPADATMFSFPAGMRALLLGCAFVSAGFAVFAVGMELTRPTPRSGLLVLLASLLFGSAAIYCVGAYRRFRDRIAVDAGGIWYLEKNGKSTFIAWSEVAQVKANDTAQRLILIDASGNRRINAEYQLGNFDTLREFVLAHTSEAARRGPTGQRVFHRSWINKIILLTFGAILLGFAIECYHQNAAKAFYTVAGLGAFLLLAVLQDPLGLEITGDGIMIRYPAWQRTIPFGSITGISLEDVKDARNGNVWAAVVIQRKRGRRIRLFRFREGSIAVNEALQSAWSAHRRL